MKEKPPEVFIQIHYHNRPGGVSVVMDRYAGLFDATFGTTGKRNIMVCSAIQGTKPSQLHREVVSYRGCDYHAYKNKETFNRSRSVIRKKLGALLQSVSVYKSVWIVAHNCSLGKNIALSAAISDLAKSYAQDTRIRFFWVIHDFAEEGRSGMLRQINLLEKAGVSVGQFLYPTSNNVRYITLNKRNHRLLKKAGFEVNYVPNPLGQAPVNIDLSRKEKSAITQALTELARHDQVVFDPQLPTCFYPVRLIQRKNILEAILVACVVLRMNLVLGSPGKTKNAQALYSRLKHWAKQWNLPVLFDAGRIERFLPASMLHEKRNGWHYLFSYAPVCISTGITEGFGYALYEPWLYSSRLIGRLPLGIAPRELIDLSYLYTSIPIPVSWIRLRTLAVRIMNALSQVCAGSPERSIVNRAVAEMIRGTRATGAIDFGMLDLNSQRIIVGRVCRSLQKISVQNQFDREVRKTLLVLERMMQRQLRTSTGVKETNVRVIKRNLVDTSFIKTFKGCFTVNRLHKKKPGEGSNAVRDYFIRANHFRLLMDSRL